jgi:hypothetical protein
LRRGLGDDVIPVAEIIGAWIAWRETFEDVAGYHWVILSMARQS